MSDFSDRVVIVTGAVGNLGEAVAKAFHTAGAKLVLVDRAPDRLGNVFPELVGSEDHFLAGSVDLTVVEDVEGMVGGAMDRFGRVDILVNTAGGYRAGTPVHETPLDTWDFMFNLNARTVFIVSRGVIPHMLERGYGKIINVSSRAGLRGGSGSSAYSASKSAVIRLTESMSGELGDKGVNVNCVLPGIIDTPENRKAMPDADFSKWVKPEEIVDVIMFLASDLAGAVHGASIPVYGRS